MENINLQRGATQPLPNLGYIAPTKSQQTAVSQTNTVTMDAKTGNTDENMLTEHTLNTSVDFDIFNLKVPKLTKAQQKEALEASAKKQGILSQTRVFLNQLADLYSPIEQLGDQQGIYLKLQGMLDMLYKGDPTMSKDAEVFKAVEAEIRDFKEAIAEAKRLMAAKENGTLTKEEVEKYPKTGTPLEAIKARIANDPKTNKDMVDNLIAKLGIKDKVKPAAPPTTGQLFNEVANKTRLLTNQMGNLYSLKEQIKDYSGISLMLSGMSEELTTFPYGNISKANAIEALKFLDEVTIKVNDYKKYQTQLQESVDIPEGDKIKFESYKTSTFPADAKKLYDHLFPGKAVPKAKDPTDADYLKEGLRQVRLAANKFDQLFSRSEQLADYKDTAHLILGLRAWLDDPPTKGISQNTLVKILDQVEAIGNRITAASDEKNPGQANLLKDAKDKVLGDIKEFSNTLFGKVPEPKTPTPKENFREGADLVRSHLGKLDDLLSKTAQYADSAPDNSTPLSIAHRQIAGLLEELYKFPVLTLSEDSLKSIVDMTDGFEIYIKNSREDEKKRLLTINEGQFRNENDSAWDPYNSGDADEIYWKSTKETGDYSVTDAITFLSKTLIGTDPPMADVPRKLRVAADHTRGFLLRATNLLTRDEQLGTFNTTYSKLKGLIENLYSPDAPELSQDKLMKVFDITERFSERLSWLDIQYENKHGIAQKKANDAKKEYDNSKATYAKAKSDFEQAKADYADAQRAYEQAKAAYEATKQMVNPQGDPQALAKMNKAQAAMNNAKEQVKLNEAAMNKALSARNKAEEAKNKADSEVENVDKWKKQMKDTLTSTLAAKVEELSLAILDKAAPIEKSPTPEEYYREGSAAARGLLERIDGLFTQGDRNTTYPTTFKDIKGLIETLSNSDGKLSRENLRKSLALVDTVQKKLAAISDTGDDEKKESLMKDLKANLDKTLLSPIKQYFKQ